ncbi:hypothetical protein AVEN_38046-1 [Araneus ventricosus]|uniref:Uncharacterized protein n=1 Tax=Araneus ventricosus TaxID=182803 RepID=A0A4Y2M259_ARAVE|nr:hypothetical protein AVEN_20431-1 [Araneus ventricosus]GBN20912.1 hypothetical protein AVEN_38046-1 [Araneus ventricosus]
MTVGDGKPIRELYKSKFQRRGSQSQREKMISLRPPKLNFYAWEYIEIIQMNACGLIPSPRLQDINDYQINSLIQSEAVPKWDLKKIPMLHKAVERCIKLNS